MIRTTIFSIHMCQSLKVLPLFYFFTDFVYGKDASVMSIPLSKNLDFLLLTEKSGFIGSFNSLLEKDIEEMNVVYSHFWV